MRRWKPTHRQLTAAVLIVIAGAGIVATVAAYRSQAVHKQSKGFSAVTNGISFNPNETPTVPVVTINAYLLSVMPETKTADFRLVFGYWQPNADLPSSYLPQHVAVSVSVLGTVTDPSENSGATAHTYTFADGPEMRSVDVRMNLGASTSQRYPFDRYIGFLVFKVTDGQGNVVQSLVNFTDLTDGWSSSADGNLCDIVNSSWYPFGSIGPDSSSPSAPACLLGATTATQRTGFEGVEISIRRALVSQLYALFIMGLMWALALAGVVMALTLMRNKNHKIEAGPLTYLAALLFAFPLIRTLLPGSPALGIVADFAAYFWVEAVVGMTLLALLLTWIRRERRMLASEAEGAAFEDS